MRVSLTCSTIVGVVCKDGIILGTEKIVLNKMMVSGTDKRSYSVAPHIGCVSIILTKLVLGCQWSCARWQGDGA